MASRLKRLINNSAMLDLFLCVAAVQTRENECLNGDLFR
jgi:hypothetical protein